MTACDPPGIVCLGEALVDFVAAEAGHRLVDCPAFLRAAGGAPANVAVGLSRWGVPVAFVGVVGEDPFGVFLRRSLAAEGVDTRWLHDHHAVRTTLAFVSRDQEGKPDFIFYRHPGADEMLTAEHVRSVDYSACRFLHFGTISLTGEPARSATYEAIELARASGASVSFDPNIRMNLWSGMGEVRRLIRDCLPLVTVIKLNEDEAELVFGAGGDPVSALLDHGPLLVAVTRGSRGATLATRQARAEIPPVAAKVVDTTGAGDAFAAALLAALHDRKCLPETPEELEEIGRRACAAGAYACGIRGAIPSLPTPEAVAALLAEESPSLQA